jgi:hypothetical protein
MVRASENRDHEQSESTRLFQCGIKLMLLVRRGRKAQFDLWIQYAGLQRRT